LQYRQEQRQRPYGRIKAKATRERQPVSPGTLPAPFGL
jgi:hypothetical protein